MDVVVPTSNGDRYQVRANHSSIRFVSETMVLGGRRGGGEDETRATIEILVARLG